jgi:hypothetical protein
MRIDHVHPRTLNKQDEGGRRYAEYFSSNKAQRQADHSPESGGSLTLSVAVACKDQSAMKSFYHSGLPQESYPNWPVVTCGLQFSPVRDRSLFHGNSPNPTVPRWCIQRIFGLILPFKRSLSPPGDYGPVSNGRASARPPTNKRLGALLSKIRDIAGARLHQTY